MGSGNFNLKEYEEKAEKAKVTTNSGFTADSMCEEFDPKKVTTRYSKKGPFNEFRDVITVLIGLDVTGSMDIIPKSLLTGELGNLMVDLKKTFNMPYENLQISFAGIGDAKTDRAPLQVTHFESDNRFAQQLQKIWLEEGGGGNGGESYNLLWWYATHKTHLNYVKKDGRKGILITIGDDKVHTSLTAGEIKGSLDDEYEGKDISNNTLLMAVRDQYEVYHLVVTNGGAYRTDVSRQWKELLGSEYVREIPSSGVAAEIAKIVTQHRPRQRLEQMNLNEEEWSLQNRQNLSDEQWKEILSYTLCPLTREFMSRPVCWGSHKRAYEEQAVEDYMRKSQMDPITQTRLIVKPDLKLNSNILQLCSDYKNHFDALPEEKRKYLVELTLGPTFNEQSEKEKRKNPYKFFDEDEPGKEKEEPKSKEETILETYKDCICSISQEIMEDPVMLVETGQTYNRKHIEDWLSRKMTDPNTGVDIKDTKLVPNYKIKDRCDEGLKKLAELKSKQTSLLNFT